MTVLVGDACERLRELPGCSVDAIVTDPPYGLEFMGKDWDRLQGYTADTGFKDFTLPRQRQRNVKCPDCEKYIYDHPGRRCECGGVRRLQARSMQDWHEAWACEALRVLKPGGHLLAFGGTRTYHRLACAIEDAGFEIRDTICWLYGSGFPKSLDVSKAIDKMNGRIPWLEFAPAFAAAVRSAGLTYTDVDRALGVGASSCYWARTDHRGGLPARRHWEALRSLLDLPGEMVELYESAEREVVAQRERSGAPPQPMWGDADGQAWDETQPATPEAERWDGWGTALKPAHEPIVVARKPLVGTVAANVLEHGTGALNVDGCRIGASGGGWNGLGDTHDENQWRLNNPDGVQRASGRWPANVVLSHSEDCVLVGRREVRANGHFPSSRGASGYGSAVEGSSGGGLKGQDDLEERHFDGELVEVWACVPGCPVRMVDDQTGVLRSGDGTVRRASGSDREGNTGAAYGAESRPSGMAMIAYGDAGGASRFFYCAKASRAERNAGLDEFDKRPILWSSGDKNLGSFQADGTDRSARNPHPTVKPIDLMRWLVRLVTPPGGTVLDPFLGSGTTGCAAALEGFGFVGVERDAEYAKIAEARIRFWREHPTGLPAEVALRADAERRRVRGSGQLGLLDA